MGQSRLSSALAMWAVCGLAAGPGLWLWYAGFTDQLGANPAEALIRGLGEWTLRFLCLTLAVTPLRQLIGWAWLARYRRVLGLWTWAYASQHFTAYLWLDMESSLLQVWNDTLQRPFILMGMLALVLLCVLAATSFSAAVRWLGAVRWRRLHLAVHLVAIASLLHFYWMRAGKTDYADVWFYAGVIALLWAWRLGHAWRKRKRALVKVL